VVPEEDSGDLVKRLPLDPEIQWEWSPGWEFELLSVDREPFQPEFDIKGEQIGRK